MSAEFDWLDRLPLPALVVQDYVNFIHVNPALEQLVGVAASTLLAYTPEQLVSRFMVPSDAASVGALTPVGAEESFELRPRIRLPDGSVRSVRIQRALFPDHTVYLVLPAEQEDAGRRLNEALISAAEGLVRVRDERRILELSAEVLCAQGMLASFLRLEGEQLVPLLSRHPGDNRERLRAALIEQLGRVEPVVPIRLSPALQAAFHTGRATFHYDFHAALRERIPAPLAEVICQRVPARAVEVPILVGEEPFAVLHVLKDDLTPAVATTVELFARLVGAALENARHHNRAAQQLDLTQRLQSELVANERLAALGEVAQVMSHEVRNPLGAILNSVAVLKNATLSPADHQSALLIVEEESQRLDRLVHDLLDLARPLDPRPRRVDLRALLPAWVEQSLTTAHRPTLKLSCGAEPVWTQLDPPLAQLAVENLIRNAAQACGPQGRIQVALTLRDGRACLAVEDDGPGIPESLRPKVFEPFFTTRASGTGLGLALVRRLVEAHGGEVQLQSSTAGGARFELLFPLAESPPG